MLEELFENKARKIGITERSDPSLNYTWLKSIKNVDCAVLISKKLTDKFIDSILQYKSKIILHHSITGYGNSIIEPNIYEFTDAFERLDFLVKSGFSKDQIVIRVDPIITTDEFFEKSLNVFNYAVNFNYKRLRFSFIDIYQHVKTRFFENNIDINFNKNKLEEYIKEIKKFEKFIHLESCCEDLYKQGCVSNYDLDILNMTNDTINSTFKQRSKCLCLPKKELLEVDIKKRCDYKCLYCYWKD